MLFLREYLKTPDVPMPFYNELTGRVPFYVACIVKSNYVTSAKVYFPNNPPRFIEESIYPTALLFKCIRETGEMRILSTVPPLYSYGKSFYIHLDFKVGYFYPNEYLYVRSPYKSFPYPNSQILPPRFNFKDNVPSSKIADFCDIKSSDNTELDL